MLVYEALFVETAESSVPAPVAAASRFAKLTAQTSGPSFVALLRRCGSDPAVADRGAADERAASLPAQTRESVVRADSGAQGRADGTFSPASARSESKNP